MPARVKEAVTATTVEVMVREAEAVMEAVVVMTMAATKTVMTVLAAWVAVRSVAAGAVAVGWEGAAPSAGKGLAAVGRR